MDKKEKRFELPVAQKAVIYDETAGKFLLLKTKNQAEFFKKHYGQWEFPGGKLEKDEGLIQGIKREIKEEIGNIEYDIHCVLNTRVAEFPFGKMLFIDYLVLYKEGVIELKSEHEDYKWETSNDIEKSSEHEQWLKKLVKKAEKRIKENDYFDSWKRCAADFENYKKRQAENQKDLIAYSNINLILEILPVLDNFHASTDHIPEGQKKSPWAVGIMHIQKQLEKVLTDNGVAEIVIKEGDKFNPEIHEAISQDTKETNINTKKNNEIKKVLMKGYKINERVIRAARVIVE
jgi:molecular chaperone GrpE